MRFRPIKVQRQKLTGIKPTIRTLQAFTKGNEGNGGKPPSTMKRFVPLVIFCSKSEPTGNWFAIFVLQLRDIVAKD
jgi:hypothetical protein